MPIEQTQVRTSTVQGWRVTKPAVLAQRLGLPGPQRSQPILLIARTQIR